MTDVMDNLNATADSVADAGHKLMVMVIAYGGKATDQLNQMHYQTYCVSAASAQGDLKPASTVSSVEVVTNGGSDIITALVVV